MNKLRQIAVILVVITLLLGQTPPALAQNGIQETPTPTAVATDVFVPDTSSITATPLPTLLPPSPTPTETPIETITATPPPTEMFAPTPVPVSANTEEITANVSPTTIYFEMVLDEARGWIYGSDSTGGRIDVISISTLQLVKRFNLSGMQPKGIALSPDGKELAVANYGIGEYSPVIGSIIFINPDTSAKIATITPTTDNPTYTRPWDVVYGRSERLYSSGNPGDRGIDYIHVINTTEHVEIGRSSIVVRSSPMLEISSDKNNLYVGIWESPQKLYKFDVSTDTLNEPLASPHVDYLHGINFLLSPDQEKIFMDSGEVWSANLKGQIGHTGRTGNLALLPTHNAIAVAGNGAISFYNVNNFYGIKTYALPVGTIIGPMAALADGNKLLVTSSAGVIAINLSAGLPGVAIPLPAGSKPYFDMVVDEAHGWIYGSDSTGNKIDVISISSLAVIKQFRLVNGASPKGIALSPDGNELAVAEHGAASIVFLNPNTGEVSSTIMPDNPGNAVKPWDVAYGRADRIYVVGNPNYLGYGASSDELHVIDVVSHTEISKAPQGGTGGKIEISADKNWLYVQGYYLQKFDITTDVISAPQESNYATGQFVLSADAAALFTNTGEVWDAQALTGQIGATHPRVSYQRASIALLPTHNALADVTDNTTGNDTLTFYRADNYYAIKKYVLPALDKIGTIVGKADGSKLFIAHSGGVAVVDLSLGLPGTVIPLPVGSKLYFDLVLDETRGVLYGSDPVGHKIDVISASSLAVIKQYRLVNGATPVGIALSPDGAELAVAEYKASKIVFLNPDTGEELWNITPGSSDMLRPWDVVYGRPGRLYSTGSPYSYGFDSLHVIDTVAHALVGGSSDLRAYPTLTISADKNTLYVNERWYESQVFKYDITTDTPALITKTNSTWIASNNILVSPAGDKIFTDDGKAWNADLKGTIGNTGQAGNMTLLPTHNAIAIAVDKANSDAISFYDDTTFYGIKTYALPNVGGMGPLVASADGNKLYVASSAGMIGIDLSLGLPGVSIPPPAGSNLYFDLVLDEARGVLYGSDSVGHKIDVISTSSLVVIKQFRLVNGAAPKGIALSPDGSELAVAAYGASSIVFLNPDTGAVIGNIMPNISNDEIQPWRLVYGRPGRLYSTGSPESYGIDYIHIIDTIAHAEIGNLGYGIRFKPFPVISADKNSLYISEEFDSIYKFDVSTDVLANPIQLRIGDIYAERTILLNSSGSKIFSEYGKVFDSALSKQIGTFKPIGKLAEIPARNVFLSIAGNQITFFNANTYQPIASRFLPSQINKIGAVAMRSDGNAIFFVTNLGVKSVNLKIFPPSPASFYSSGAEDGWILESTETSNQGGIINTSGTLRVGDSAANQQYRSILSFNTYPLPDNAVITGAMLKIKSEQFCGTNLFTTHGDLIVDIRKGAFGIAALQISDFRASASKNNVGKFIKTAQTSGYFYWYTAALQTLSYPYINRNGVTQFRLRFSKDDNDNHKADCVNFFSGNADINSRPILSITYAVP